MTDGKEVAENIVFFDGYCVLCNGLVDFLLRIDKENRLKFSSLQGETAQTHLDNKYSSYPNTVVFLKSVNDILEKSDAILEIAKTVGGFWGIFSYFKFIPKKMRDSVYDLIAKYRYTIFGKRTSCRLPTAEEKDKILT